MENNKIHIAFGFHVNCYHSYRGDSNDNLGFGSDIRIINKILDTLTEFNENGVPVKGTWDSENFFSLQKIFPEFAPEILEKMKERVKKYGDENIIMGYSNGALGAMNDCELSASIERAVTNKDGSGLSDIFGECEMLVRPQEVMFTPSQVSTYNKLGVKALCLYYSCVPFDAFRTIIPKLDDEKAFNPLTYTYKGESMLIIPTYNNSDICDAGCLRAWVKELRKKQLKGEINSDLLMFINMDADAIFWESMNLPVIGNRVANTDGIHGLVKEVADLDYVVFDTPGGYLKTHGPVGEISFTQDTADGNFTGYASWSEKPYNRKVWTAVERSRALSRVNAESDFDAPSFDDRVILLSTTHFGLATPVLNIQREKKADALCASMLEKELEKLGSSEELVIHNITNSPLQCVQLKLNRKVLDASALEIAGDCLEDFAIASTDAENKTVFAMLKFSKIQDKYTVKITEGKPKQGVFTRELKTDRLKIKFTDFGKIESVECDGEKIGDSEFLKSFITYNGRELSFSKTAIKPLTVAGSGAGLRIKGEIHLPEEIHGGSFCYDFFTTGFSNAVFVITSVNYPYTLENTSISTENSALGRFSDMKWQEAVPFQITPRLKGDIKVIKRNFADDISSFRTQSFAECDAENKSLASFNHQLTAGMIGICGENRGLIVTNARQVLNSMAHCPMRLDEDKTVHLNPFGTYYGKQRHHWSRSKGQILDTYTLVTPQGKSIAPAYNGNSEAAVLALYGFSGEMPDSSTLAEITAFADGAIVTSNDSLLAQGFYGDNVTVKTAKSDGVNEARLRNPIMSGIGGNVGKYITKGSKAIFHIIKSQIRSAK